MAGAALLVIVPVYQLAKPRHSDDHDHGHGGHGGNDSGHGKKGH